MKVDEVKGPFFTKEQYFAAINRLTAGVGQLEPDGNNCAICGDGDHQAWECHHNPLRAIVFVNEIATRCEELHEILHYLGGMNSGPGPAGISIVFPTPDDVPAIWKHSHTFNDAQWELLLDVAGKIAAGGIEPQPETAQRLLDKMIEGDPILDSNNPCKVGEDQILERQVAKAIEHWRRGGSITLVFPQKTKYDVKLYAAAREAGLVKQVGQCLAFSDRVSHTSPVPVPVPVPTARPACTCGGPPHERGCAWLSWHPEPIEQAEPGKGSQQ